MFESVDNITDIFTTGECAKECYFRGGLYCSGYTFDGTLCSLYVADMGAPLMLEGCARDNMKEKLCFVETFQEDILS